MHTYLLCDFVVTPDGEQVVYVDSILDENWEYSGKYRATVNNYTTEIELDDNAIWVEKGIGETDLAMQVGDIIENFYE